MLRFLFTALMALAITLPLSACADQETSGFVAGTHYRVLDNPVPTADQNQIEVREFFFYGCPHCYNNEPLVEQWKKGKADNVSFVGTPVLFLRDAEPLARAFYVAEAKGILATVHAPLFDAIHKHHKRLSTTPALAAFFAEYGVAEEEFNELYSSFGVSTKIRQADALTRDYQLTGVPAYTVNGKYVVLRKNLKSDVETFRVLDYLVAKERKLLGK